MLTFSGTDGGIFEVTWNRAGNKLAACTAGGSVRSTQLSMIDGLSKLLQLHILDVRFLRQQ